MHQREAWKVRSDFCFASDKHNGPDVGSFCSAAGGGSRLPSPATRGAQGEHEEPIVLLELFCERRDSGAHSRCDGF